MKDDSGRWMPGIRLIDPLEWELIHCYGGQKISKKFCIDAEMKVAIHVIDEFISEAMRID